MDNEFIIRILAVIVAVILLLSNVNLGSMFTSAKNWIFKKKAPVVLKKEVSFIEIIQSWHVLKEQCETYGLNEAVKKIDEVFPLLNVEE